MHAIQAAEACRKAYPGDEYDWFHVTCFIHDLGKILLVNDPVKDCSFFFSFSFQDIWESLLCWLE